MPVHYCSQCGAPAQYSVTKPERCPKCGKALKAAVTASFAPVKIVPSAPAATTEDDNDMAPLVVPAAAPSHSPRKTFAQKPTGLAAARAKAKAAAKAAEVGGDDPALGGTEDDPDDEPCDPRAVRRLARELIANIDPSTIHVGNDDGEDDRPVRYGDLVRAAARSKGDAG